MNRDISPIRQAEEAVLVDSSNLTIEESAGAILELIDKDLAERVIGESSGTVDIILNESK